MQLPQQFGWSSAGVSDVGKVRSVNEDAVGMRPEIGLWVVADGMGGHAAGDVASAAVVQALADVTFSRSLLSFINRVKSSLEQVNRDLIASSGPGHMGTTVVLLLAYGDQCACLWVGDSRVYRVRNDVMHAITRDHSYVEELVQLGQLAPEEAEHHPNANIITRAIGAAETVEFDVGIYDLQDQDRFLLCSDGLYREVSEQDIFRHMRRGECEQVVEVLLQLALDNGAKDNVSIVAVEFARQP